MMPTPRSAVNTAIVPNVVTFPNMRNERVIADYVAYRTEIDNWRPKTIQTRTNQLRHIAAQLDPIHLVAATEDQLITWYRSRTGSPETRAAYLSAVHGIYQWMATYARPRIRVDNPAAAIKRPKIPEAPPRPLRDRDYDLAVACSVSNPELYIWLGLMGCSGLRCCEIAWLRVEDVEPLEDGGGMLHVLGKGGKRRDVPIGRYLLLTMQPFLRGHRRGPVFTRPSDEGPHTPQMVSQTVNNFLREILDTRATAHMLRHRFGTDYHGLDADLYRQAKIMGHASVDTTQRYTEISPVEAARHIEELTRRRFGGLRSVS